MAYCLENDEEGARLEVQAQGRHYQVSEEFNDLKLFENKRVLDAGCGSGIGARFIVENCKGSQVEACDFLNRITEAKKISGSNKIRFFDSNLENINSNNNSYGAVYNRFVMHHLVDPLKVTSEFYRILEPGGYLHIIDIDGILLNISTKNEKLNKLVEELRGKWKALHVARKVPSMLKEVGFKNVQYRIVDMDMNNREDKSFERSLYSGEAGRMELIRPTLSQYLGKTKAEYFITSYIDALSDDDTELFYKKHIITANK